MIRWHRLREELPLLWQAYRVVWVTRMRLWTLPFHTLRTQQSRVAVNPHPAADRPTPQHLAWTVVVASRFVPGATCLTQALAADLLLRRYGYQGEIRLGVAWKPNKQLTAHAWLEYDGAILLGGRRHYDFQQLPPGTF